MRKITEEKRAARVRNRRVHMANERTFLAWIRTSIGIMAFGFVVEKFAMFIEQVKYLLGKPRYDTIPVEPAQTGFGYSSIFGILLIGLGALMGALAFIKYKKVERQIDKDTYQPSILLDILLTIAISAIGIFLILYLIHSIK